MVHVDFLGCWWCSDGRLFPKGTNYTTWVAHTRKFYTRAPRNFSRSICCSTSTMPLFTSLPLPWLPLTVVALIWLGIRPRSIRLSSISKTENGHFRYPLSVRWCCHPCSEGHSERSYNSLSGPKTSLAKRLLGWKLLQLVCQTDEAHYISNSPRKAYPCI
jgi:hypothetical protein